MPRPDAYEPFDGLSLTEFLGQAVSAVRLDADLNVLDATPLAAKVAAIPLDEMVGLNLTEVTQRLNNFHWLDWISQNSIEEMFQRFVEGASERGSHGEQLYWVTTSQMCYSAVAVCYHNPLSGNFILMGTMADVASRLPSKRSMSSPVSISADGAVITTNGSVVTQEHLSLLRDYCNAPSVAALASSQGISAKAMEYRLQKLAEAYNRGSISELIKGFAIRDLDRFPGSENTFPVNSHFEIADAIRYEKLPAHLLPRTRVFGSLAKEKRVAMSDRVAKLKDKIARRYGSN